MARKIQFKRGIKANLPKLSLAEIAFTTDEKQMYIGDGVENIRLLDQKYKEKMDKNEINILDYSDYVTANDWSLAFERAINDSPVGGRITFPKNTYKGEFNITKSMDIDFKGSTLIPNGLNKDIINIVGNRSSTNYMLSSKRIRGQKEIPLTTTPTDISSGDLIVLVDDSMRTGGLAGINIEVHRVKTVRGNTLLLEDFVRREKNISSTSNVYKINPIKDVRIENVVCEGLTGVTSKGGGINAHYVENITVRNFKMNRNFGSCISFRTSYNCIVDGFNVSDPIATEGGQGYGLLSVRGTSGFFARNGLVKGMRHAVDCAETYDALVDNVIATSSISSSFVLSHNSYGSDIKFRDCKAYNCVTYGFQISSQGVEDIKTATHYNMHLERCEVEFDEFVDNTAYAIGVSYECPVKESTIDIIIRKGDGNTKPSSTNYTRLDGVRTTSNGNDLRIRLRASGLINAVLADIGDYTVADKETDSIRLEDAVIENCTHAIRFKNAYALSLNNVKIKNIDVFLFNYYDSTQLKLRYFNMEDILLDGYTTFASYDFSTIAHANGILGRIANIKTGNITASGSISTVAGKSFTMEEILTSRNGRTLKITATANISLNNNPLPNGWFIGQKVTISSMSGANIVIPKGSNMTTEGNRSVILSNTNRRAVTFEWTGTSWVQEGGAPISLSTIATVPQFVGQTAIVSGIAYISVGTTATTDWKQITT